MSPASYQTAPPRDVSFRCLDPGPILRSRCLLWQRTDLQACYLENLTTCADTHIRGGRSGPYNCESKHLLRLERAGNGTRTRDPNLGKVVLYQLSYSRETERILVSGPPRRNDPRLGVKIGRRGSHGGEGDRTPDLVNAIHALSQLSYAPVTIVPPSSGAAAARKRTPRISECQRGQRPHRGHSRRTEGYSCSYE